jgi:hypothetical protein
MKDEVIRIILEAKDRLSKTVRDAERNVNQSFGNIRNDLKKTDRDFDKFQNDFTRSLNKSDSAMKRWSTSMRQHLRGVQKEIVKFNDTNIAAGKVTRGPGGQFQSIRQQRIDEAEARRQARRDAIAQSGPGRAFSAFQQGRSQAAELERQLREQIATTKENLADQKRKLEERIHLERESVIQEGNIKREQLRRDIVQRNKNLDAQILKITQAEANRQAKRDEALNNRIRKTNAAFEDRRKKAEDSLRDEIYQRKQLFYDEQYERKQKLRDDIAEVNRSPISKLARQKEIDALNKAYSDTNRKEQRARDDAIRQLEIADDKIKRSDATARDIAIAEQKSAAAEIRRKDSLATDDKVRKLKAGASEVNKEDEVALSHKLRQRRQAAETEFRELRQGLRTGANEADIVKEFLASRKAEQALNRDTSRLGTTFRSAGNAFGDFTRGLRRGRSDLRGVDNLARRADTGFARFGQTIGRFTKNIGNLVNLRWYILISAIQVLGQLVLVLASNLISLASSAAMAASALGAGLAAAAAQAIPVVGLLAAAFSRVTAAFTAAQQAQKANATSSQDARAQAEAQTAAQQSLTDALYSQKQAVQALADARKQAQRDIVDAIFAERDANFALKDAEFAVLDAKQRLRDLENQNRDSQQAVRDAEAAVREAKARLAAAKAEGDQAEIEQARVQLAVAQQNLADAKGQAAQSDSTKRQVAEQKLAVKEAQQQLEEARVAAKRQRQDTQEVVAAGVNGSKSVVDALHGVAQANRDVADAQRGVTDASRKQLSAGNLLQRQLSQLDPAERELYKVFRRVYKNFKDTFRPITDIIVRAVADAVSRFGQVLNDHQFTDAFRGLARAIARGIGDLSKFFTSKGFIKDFVGFIHAATSNIPTVIRIIENLAGAFVGLAKAGQPIVKDLLGRFAGITGRFAAAINSPASLRGGAGGAGESPQRAQQQGRETRGQKFIASAKTYLDSWIKLADAIGRVFRYLFQDAAPTGNSLVLSMTRMFNNLANFLRDNPQKVKRFFDSMFTSLKEISSVLFPLVKVLLSAFTGSNAAAFTQFTAQVVLPGLTLMLELVSQFAKVLLFLTQLPGVKFFLQLLVAEKALNRVFPATQRITDAVKRMGGWFFKAGEDGSRGFTKLWRAMRFTAFRIKYYAVLARDQISRIGSGAKRAADAIVAGSKRMVTALKNVVVQVGRFVYAMAVSALSAVKKFVIAIATEAYNALKTFATFIVETVIPRLYAMGVAMYVALGPWGLIAAAVVILIGVIVLLLRHFHVLRPVINAIGDAFKFLFNWIKDHWKKIVNFIMWPFDQAIRLIKLFFVHIYNAFKSAVNWIKDHWKGLAQVLIAIFLPGGIIIAAIWKWHDKILDIAKKIVFGIGHFFKRLPHLVLEALKDLPGAIVGLFKNVGKKIAKEIFDFIPPKLRGPLAKALHLGKDAFDIVTDPVGDVKGLYNQVFEKGGVVAGKDGKAVPVLAHAGEWVLNKKQQMKAAMHLDMPIQNLKHFLFGDPQKKRRKQRQDAADMHHHRGDIHASGGRVKGANGQPVRIIAHAGEWILDKAQQSKLARRFRESIAKVATFLFGEPKTKKKDSAPPHSPGTSTHGANTTHKKKRQRKGGKFFPYNLVGETDDNGNIVYFVEDTEEQFLELAKIDALHMLRTNGKFIPRWIEKYGYHLKRFKNAAAMAKGYAEGGIVGMNTPTYDMGGVVNSPQSNYDTSAISNVGGNTNHKKIEQNFKVHTQGETDWNYVMRLAAMHAESSF